MACKTKKESKNNSQEKFLLLCVIPIFVNKPCGEKPKTGDADLAHRLRYAGSGSFHGLRRPAPIRRPVA